MLFPLQKVTYSAARQSNLISGESEDMLRETWVRAVCSLKAGIKHILKNLYVTDKLLFLCFVSALLLILLICLLAVQYSS